LRAASTLIEVAEKGLGENLGPVFDTLGENLNARRWPDGNTALHIAIQNGNKDLVTLLIEKGASLDTANHSNETPIQLALKLGNPYVIALVCIAQIQRLSIVLEKAYEKKESKEGKERKERKEALETCDIKATQEEMSKALNEVLNQITKGLSPNEKSKICLR